MSSLINKLNHTVQCKEDIKQAINNNLGGGTELVNSSTPFDEYGQIINPVPDNISQYSPFSSASWTEIKEVADLGYGKYVYNKGDTKQVGKYTVMICAFDYDSEMTSYTQNVSKKANITFSLGYIPFTNITVDSDNTYQDFSSNNLMYGQYAFSDLGKELYSLIQIPLKTVVRIYSYNTNIDTYFEGASVGMSSPCLYIANEYDLKFFNIGFSIPSDCTFAWDGNSNYYRENTIPGYNPSTLEGITLSGKTQSKLYANICFCL